MVKTARTNVERQRAWQARKDTAVSMERAKLDGIVEAIMKDVTFEEKVVDGKRTVVIDMSVGTRAAIDHIMKAQGTTFDEVMRNSVNDWLAMEAKLRSLKAKHEGEISHDL